MFRHDMKRWINSFSSISQLIVTVTEKNIDGWFRLFLLSRPSRMVSTLDSKSFVREDRGSSPRGTGYSIWNRVSVSDR